MAEKAMIEAVENTTACNTKVLFIIGVGDAS
jgi:hypothetical protein